MAEEEEQKELNYTLYVRSLDEGIPKEGASRIDIHDVVRSPGSDLSSIPAELRKMLQTIFSQWGNVLSVYVSRSLKLRGQAWVIFDNVDDAATAMDELDGFPLNEIPMVRLGN